MEAPFVRSPYNYDTKAASQESATINNQPSLTLQDDADDADINVIVARFGLTGTMPNDPRPPMYGDFTEITDYQTALSAVENANKTFYELPPHIRNKFDNNPQRLLEFAAQPLNDDQMIAFGFATTQDKQNERTELHQQTNQGSTPPTTQT